MFTRTSWLLLCLLLAVWIAAGCGNAGKNTGGGSGGTASQPNTAESSDEEEAQVSGEFINAYTASADMQALPSLMTWKRLAEEGNLIIEAQHMSATEQAVQAVATGQAAFSGATTISVLQAIRQGAPLKIFAAYTGNPNILVVRSEYQNPEDLEGKRFAVHSPQSFNAALVHWAIDHLGIQNPQILIVPNSDVRASAMLNGEIDAAAIEINDWARLQLEKPGEFSVLVNYAEEVPGLTGQYYFASEKFLQENRAVIKTIVKEYLLTIRSIIDDPSVGVEGALQVLPDLTFDRPFLEKIVPEFLAIDEWLPNGGMDEETVKNTLRFNQETNTLPPDADLDQIYRDYFDPSIVQEVLGEIGVYEGKK